MKKIICEWDAPDLKAVAYAWEECGKRRKRIIAMHRNVNEGFVVLMVRDIDDDDADVEDLLECNLQKVMAADKANAGLPLSFSFIEGGMVFKAASFGDWHSDAEWLHCEFGKMSEARPIKAVEDVVNDLYDFTGNLIGETGDGHPYVDVFREMIPRRGRHFKDTAVTRVFMNRMEILVIVRIRFDPYDDLYGEMKKSILESIESHGMKNMSFKEDDLCMSCLEHRRDKVDTMMGVLLQSGMPEEFVNMVKELFACG